MNVLTPMLRAARLPWPLPAVLAWAAGWLAWRLALAGGASPLAAVALAGAASAAAAMPCAGAWRRAIAMAGFPLALLALGAAGRVAAWAWLLPLLPLLALYPLRAWRDAPLFPTPHDALQGLDTLVGRPAHVLDAGCGMGHGLAALRRLWPQAVLVGVEWSPLLAWAAARRQRTAEVRRGDMWAGCWAGYDLVYLFQRPESMVRAYRKAADEMAPGSWLVSLEFAVPDVPPVASLQGPGRKPVWVYQPAGSTKAARRR